MDMEMSSTLILQTSSGRLAFEIHPPDLKLTPSIHMFVAGVPFLSLSSSMVMKQKGGGRIVRNIDAHSKAFRSCNVSLRW